MYLILFERENHLKLSALQLTDYPDISDMMIALFDFK